MHSTDTLSTSGGPDSDRVTFDPMTEAEWEDLRRLGHSMLDEMVACLKSLPSRPSWQPLPDEKRAVFDEDGPDEGVGNEAAYELFRTNVLHYGNGNWHPRFLGWVQGSGTPLAMLSDMLASGMNPHLAGFNQAPALVEMQVIRWLASWMGIPDASGLLVTGGTMANMHAVAVARFHGATRAGIDIRENGTQGWRDQPAPPPMVFYGSAETHNWALKTAEWLGLGRRAFRKVPVNADFTIRLDELERMMEADRRAGFLPFCVVGTAGTVNTGSTDDLPALAELCKRESLWFHVDGAFGAMVALSPMLRERVHGIELADSIAFDLHKWGSMPFECACVLVRDGELHEAAFRQQATYLGELPRGVSAGGQPFNDRGLDLTRGFKALKIWMQLRADGVRKFAQIIEQNVRQVERLVELIKSNDNLELLAPAPLNIVCFRYNPAKAKLTEETLDLLNIELLQRLQERGIATPSSTRIEGRFALRVAHVNHRTTIEDIDSIARAVVSIGDELMVEYSGQT